MPLLMHFCFDNSVRLSKNVYYFEYRGVRFKLIQNNPSRSSDVLLTLVPLKDTGAHQKAYATAGEFLSALSWQNRSRVALKYCGGWGAREGDSLRHARCRVFDFPQIFVDKGSRGGHPSVIPEIESDEQRTALVLFREARSSNKVWLTFLLYWQVMEVGGNKVVSWVNRTYRKSGVRLKRHELQQLPLKGRSLGGYLLDDCRHAIAHLRRRPGRHRLRLDDSEEISRMAISTEIVERFAGHYIRKELGLGKKLYLVKGNARGFPVFVKQSQRGGTKPAYS